MKLDATALRILKGLKDADNKELNTSEAKTVTGIENNDIVRTRFYKLEDAGLVSISDDEDTDHQISPKQARLTPEGLEKARGDEWDLEAATRNLSDQDRLDRLENRLDNLDERLTEIEDAATTGDDRVPELEETRRLVTALQGAINEELNPDLGAHYPQPRTNMDED